MHDKISSSHKSYAQEVSAIGETLREIEADDGMRPMISLRAK